MLPPHVPHAARLQTRICKRVLVVGAQERRSARVDWTIRSLTGATQEPRAFWFPLTLPSPAPGGGKTRSNSIAALIPNYYHKLLSSAVQSPAFSSLPPARGMAGVRGILRRMYLAFQINARSCVPETRRTGIGIRGRPRNLAHYGSPSPCPPPRRGEGKPGAIPQRR